MAPLSEEEENYLRLVLLLKGVSSRAVRSFFNSEFPPAHLPSTLNKMYNSLYDLKEKRVLNPVQWNLLFPRNGVPDSKTFDSTLMVCLIRHLTSVTQPINGFDRLPLPRETTPGPDLARIKWYRNILAHHDSDTMATADFDTAWSDISTSISRLGGQPMYQECQELKVKILDKSFQEILMEVKQSQGEMVELRQTIDKLSIDYSDVKENFRKLQDSYNVLENKQTDMAELWKDPIPWNFREQILEELEAWKENDKMFIETSGARCVLKCIRKHGCVIVTGSSGTGKSSLVRHVALQMQEGGYAILPLTNPEEIINWYNPSKKILFVVDDFCGIYTINHNKF